MKKRIPSRRIKLGKVGRHAKRRPVYLGIALSQKGELVIAVRDQKKVRFQAVRFSAGGVDAAIRSWVRTLHASQPAKIVAAGIDIDDHFLTKAQVEGLASHLWLQEDIVPYIEDQGPRKLARRKAELLAKQAEGHFESNDQVVKIGFDERRKVEVSPLVCLSDYEKELASHELSELRKLSQIAREQGVAISFFSSTPRGGGVALMRHALMRFFELWGVKADWYVMSPEARVFEITKKKFHNVLQGISSSGAELTGQDKQIYEKWIRENVRRFTPIFKRSTMIVIDDPQPSGMISYIKKINPKAMIVYRSHHHLESQLIEKPRSVQGKTWRYLWKNIKKADYFVSHPVEKFVPPGVSRSKVILMGATTDRLDGLNKPLNREQTKYYLNLFNDHLKKEGQTPLDAGRPYITQVARFDPSKGIPDVLLSYVTLRERLLKKGWQMKDIPQLVIVGHGAVDDPEGFALYKQTLASLKTDTVAAYADDIKVVRLHHNDQILNAILSESKIVLQLSHREGFEIKVSEALAKGKPVIAYDVGGIPLQIENTTTGYLVGVGNTEAVARRMYALLTYKPLYDLMSERAWTRVRRESFTPYGAIQWLLIATGRAPRPPFFFKRALTKFLLEVGVPRELIF